MSDLISREALLKEFKRYISAEENARNYRTADVWRWALLDVQEAPAIDVNVIDDIVNDNVNGNVKAILDKIRAFKREAKEFASSDYRTGYLSAMSALEGFIAGLPAVGVRKWISVKDMLPETEGKYIVCTAKGSVYCTRFKAYGKSGDFQTDMNTHVTHWMPLPEPPEEEIENGK